MGQARVSDETKLYICEMLEKGCTYRQIKQDLHVSTGTIAAVKKEFYKEDDDVNNRVIAGDKFNGLLKTCGKGLFVGTCRTQDGKFEKRRFNCDSSNEAKKQWEEWKKSILEKEKPVDKSPINVAPVRFRKTPQHPEGVAYGAKNKDEDAAVTKIAIPKDRIYILAVGTPKIAGWYSDYNEAQRVMRIANQALDFAGVDIRYSIMAVDESTFGNEE